MGIGKVSKRRFISAATKRRREHKRQVREAGAVVLFERRTANLAEHMRDTLERMHYAMLEGKEQ